MAVPKRRTSRSNTRHRKSTWKAEAVSLTTARTPDGRTVRIPPRLRRAVERGLVTFD